MIEVSMASTEPGLTVLFRSKTENEPDKYENELAKIGLRCHFIPVLSFKFVNVRELARKLEEFHNYSGLILTSSRAVEAIEESLQYVSDWRSHLQAKWQELKIFVVGPATCELIKTSLGLMAIGSKAGNAEELGKVIKNEIIPGSKPLLFPCGNLSKETIPTMMKEYHISLECLVVYETEANGSIRDNLTSLKQEEGNPEYAVYFSPSGVKFTYSILEELGFSLQRWKFIAIGPTTRDVIIKHGLPVIGTAREPTPTGVVDAIGIVQEERDVG